MFLFVLWPSHDVYLIERLHYCTCKTHATRLASLVSRLGHGHAHTTVCPVYKFLIALIALPDTYDIALVIQFMLLGYIVHVNMFDIIFVTIPVMQDSETSSCEDLSLMRTKCMMWTIA